MAWKGPAVRRAAFGAVVLLLVAAIALTVTGGSSRPHRQLSSAGTHQPSTTVPAGATAATVAPTTSAPPTTAVPPTAAPATAAPATAAPATAAPATAAPTTAAPAPVAAVTPPGGAIAIGDSVLEDVALYAPTTLTAHGVVINAAVSRQWRAGESIVASLRAAGRLPSVVVMALGTNGPITATDFDAMMAQLAGASRVVFMTVTGPVAANNAVIRAGVARYGQDVLADWASLSAPHPTWFAADHVHVGPLGAAALGQLLASLL